MFILKLEFAIFAYILVFSLSSMDIFHVCTLLMFVWASLYQRSFAKCVWFVSFYAAVFILAKYIYTLMP